MTSPNEPGHSGPGDSPNGTGRERGRDATAAVRRPPVAGADSVSPAAVSTSPNAEARLNRFISGSAAPGAAKTPSSEAEPVPNESRENDAYASELPDLSGPIPRGAQRKSAWGSDGQPR